MKTMICLILDRSGSMQGRETDVIGGVNAFIEEQKKLPDPASIVFVRFDTGHIERFRPMQDLSKVEPLTAGDYQPRGGTPLLDAVGQTINGLDDDWKTEKPERAIVVIVTDGQENASQEYTKEKIKTLIQARQESGLWAFIYLGANVDAFDEAGSMGIAVANTAGFQNTTRGIKQSYAAASASVGHMRATGATLSTNLGGNIDEDGKVHRSTSRPAVQSSAPAKSWTPPAITPSAAKSGAWTPPS